jgi:hypothetical protein
MDRDGRYQEMQILQQLMKRTQQFEAFLTRMSDGSDQPEDDVPISYEKLETEAIFRAFCEGVRIGKLEAKESES